MMVVIIMMVMVVVVMEEDVEGEGPICFIFLCLRVFIYKMVKVIASTSRAGVKMKREYLYRLGLYLANTPIGSFAKFIAFAHYPWFQDHAKWIFKWVWKRGFNAKGQFQLIQKAFRGIVTWFFSLGLFIYKL